MRARYTPATLYLVPYLKERRKDGSLAVPVFSPQPTRWVLHCQAGDGPLRWFRDLKYPNRKNSHLWVSRKGDIEQYVPLNRWSWAQRDGNSGWISVETEGTPDEELTDAQLTELARWHVWCGAADTVTNSPSGQGIGTHSMGGAAWGGHACPGPIRAAQRKEIIRRAQQIRAKKKKGSEMDLNDIVYTEKNGVPVNVRMCLRSAYRLGLALSNEGTVEDINAIRAAVEEK